MLIFIITIISLSIYILKNFPKVKYKYDTLLLKLPFIGSLIEIGELSRFAYMNSILIKSGVPVVQAFKLGSNILKNSVISLDLFFLLFAFRNTSPNIISVASSNLKSFTLSNAIKIFGYQWGFTIH